MRYLSLFSGIEAASVAWAGPPLNWTPVAFAEIEPFPCAVLKHHYPEVPNLGDVTAADFVDRAKALGPIDVVIGGSPCQAFSCAGLRKSLDDHRGNLTLRYMEIINALDPDVVVWENVCGVLNTKDNAFGCFLAGLAGADAPLVPTGKRGRWTDAGMVIGPQRRVAFRVLDARYFSLAQRRRRVFVVASPRTGYDPAEILLEPQGLRRDLGKSRQARQSPAADVAASVAIRGRGDGRTAEVGESGVANALLLPNGGRDGLGAGAILAPATFQNTGHGYWQSEPVAQTLRSEGGAALKANLVGLPDPAYALTGGPSGNQFGSGRDGQDTTKVSCPEGQTEATAFDPNQVTSKANRSNPRPGVCHTLPASEQPPVIAFNHQDNQNFEAREELTNPLRVGQTEAVCVQLSGDRSDHGVSTSEEQAFTLPANPMSDRGQAVAFRTNQTGGQGPIHSEEVTDTLTQDHPPAVCFQQNTREEVRLTGGDGAVAGALSAEAGAHQQNYVAAFKGGMGAKAGNLGCRPEESSTLETSGPPTLVAGFAVRRLLPEECEALQGFPREYTNVPYRGKPAADGPRYKSLGNSMATNVISWIGLRIQAVADAGNTADSLPEADR